MNTIRSLLSAFSTQAPTTVDSTIISHGEIHSNAFVEKIKPADLNGTETAKNINASTRKWSTLLSNFIDSTKRSFFSFCGLNPSNDQNLPVAATAFPVLEVDHSSNLDERKAPSAPPLEEQSSQDDSVMQNRLCHSKIAYEKASYPRPLNNTATLHYQLAGQLYHESVGCLRKIQEEKMKRSSQSIEHIKKFQNRAECLSLAAECHYQSAELEVKKQQEEAYYRGFINSNSPELKNLIAFAHKDLETINAKLALYKAAYEAANSALEKYDEKPQQAASLIAALQQHIPRIAHEGNISFELPAEKNERVKAKQQVDQAYKTLWGCTR